MTTYRTQFYQSYIANNKPNKHNPNNQNNDINVGFTTNTKFVLLQLRQRKFWSNHIQILTNFKKFIFKKNVHFIHHQFLHFIDPEKPVRGLINNFAHFIHLYMNPLPTKLSTEYWKLANNKLHPRISWSIKGNYKSYTPIQKDVVRVCTKNWK